MASETSEHGNVDFANSNTSCNNTVTASTRFQWDKEKKVENLIRCLANYSPKWNSQIRTSMQTKFTSMMKTEKE